MSKYTPAQIDALLNAKGTLPKGADIPAHFFEDMEERIIAKTSAQPVRSHSLTRTGWIAAAAAVLLLLVCTVTLQNVRYISDPHTHSEDLYAVTDNMTDDDIRDLDELYDADIFLAEI